MLLPASANLLSVCTSDSFAVPHRFFPWIHHRARLFFRAAITLFVYFLLVLPLRHRERRRYNNKIAHTQLPEDPVFLLGHWRSGTTFLHQLMARDTQFGVMTNYWTFYPWFITGQHNQIKAVLAKTIPAKRWDHVSLSADSPQEEEFALYRLFGVSAYLGWHFPKRLEHFFQKYALLQVEEEAGRQRFGQQYLGLLKRLTAACGGKRLLLKNPPNTGRVSLLLELFPNARFIYLHRDPAEVFHSTIRMHQQMLDRFALTPAGALDLQVFVPAFYARLIERFEAEKSLIPGGHLAEIAYERMVKDPEATLRDIYAALDLPGYSAALPAFRAYLETQKNFHPAAYRMTSPERAVIRRLMLSGKPILSTFKN